MTNSSSLRTPFIVSLPLYLLATFVVLAVVWSYRYRIDISVEAKGIVRPEGDLVRVTSESAGPVRLARLREGLQVMQGDTLIQLDTSDLDLKKSLLLTRIHSSEARLEQLRSTFSRIADLEARSLQVDQLQDAGQQRELNLELEQSRRKFNQTSRLFQEGLSARQAVDEAAAALQRAEMEAGKWTRGALAVKQGQSQIRLEERLNELDAARSDLRDLYQQLEQLSLDIARRTVISPASGQLATVSPLHTGEWLAAGSAIATIVPAGFRPTIECWLSTAERDWIEVGTAVRIHPERILAGDDPGEEARVVSIAPDARMAEGKAAHRVVVETLGSGQELKLGTSFRLYFISRQERLLWVLLRRIHDPFDD